MALFKLKRYDDNTLDRQIEEICHVINRRHFGNEVNYSEFEIDGTLICRGDATCWKDIDIDLSAQTSGGSVPSLIAVNGDP